VVLHRLSGRNCTDARGSRAKLKRLTNEDRERVLRSRALPADFDTTQALHSAYGAQAPSVGAPISTIGAYGYGDNGGGRSLTLDTMRRVPEYEQYGQQYASPTGVSPALGAFAFTPPPSASDHISPGSVAGSVSPYVLHNSAPYDSSRRLPTGLPAVGHTPYPSQPQHLQRMPLHERLGRTMGEPTSSPLRSSVSYAHLTSASAQPRHIPERAASFSEHGYAHQRPQYQSTTSHGSGDAGPHGLGFSCESNVSSSRTRFADPNRLTSRAVPARRASVSDVHARQLLIDRTRAISQINSSLVPAISHHKPSGQQFSISVLWGTVFVRKLPQQLCTTWAGHRASVTTTTAAAWIPCITRHGSVICARKPCRQQSESDSTFFILNRQKGTRPAPLVTRNDDTGRCSKMKSGRWLSRRHYDHY
jgi:hypothetical protein